MENKRFTDIVGVEPTLCRGCNKKTISVQSEDRTHYNCPKCDTLK